MQSVGDEIERGDITDWLALSLRAYSEPAKVRNAQWTTPQRPAPSDWVLIFDCETKTTPDQRLRFGAYQLRYKGKLWERGVFHDAEGLSPEELQTLRLFMLAEVPGPDGEKRFVRTREAFVEEVFFKRAFLVGAQIVGLNLPFDLSRLAIRHVNARGSMKGGFSLVLSENRRRPKVAVKHLSARAALIRFTGASIPKSSNLDADREERSRSTDRGYFVDVKTLAATLTSASHSLESLCKFLDAPTQKRPTDEHDAPLTPSYIRYALDDVQATWECFEALSERVAKLGLPDVTLHELYSEASLGKAYLKAMGIKPWREVQPDFPKAIIGQIMSAYFGGRAEVHIRRQICEVIHCDFLSMYPTVCTLMGLWRFVIADGVDHFDATTEVRAMVDQITTSDLQSQAAWSNLATLVQVEPDQDVLPVRACYGENDTPNIGLNFLSADEPLWFTLADVIASKILTGKPAKIVQAIRFQPKNLQSDLRAVPVAGETLDPRTSDFYRDLIDQRSKVKARAQELGADKSRLDAEQLAIKILANSTSYGIFMELNVEDRSKPSEMRGYGSRPDAMEYASEVFEKPGRYFHPLLGALITGAARLMLALAEHQVTNQGLNWAFCDTDSIAIANTANLDRDEFRRRAEAVQAWFKDLNPYEQPGPILKIEDVNFSEKDGAGSEHEPLYCLAISAKRYVLFNRGDAGEPLIRKASGHGLGHLMDPYDDAPEVTGSWIKRVGAPRWQADVWREIILAHDAGKPDVVPLSHLPGFNAIARSRYGATTPALLSWFDQFNEGKTYAETVKPFNFMLSLQLRSDIDIASADLDMLAERSGATAPRPAAPFSRSADEAADQAFDRTTGRPIPRELLKPLARSLTRYHLHSESKFLGGEDDAAGVLQRRRVHALALRMIGKESDALEERTYLGEGEADITHPLQGGDVRRLFEYAWRLQSQLGISDRDLQGQAGISHHTLAKLRRFGGKAEDALRLVRAMEVFRKRAIAQQKEDAELLALAHLLAEKFGGVARLAQRLHLTRQYVGRILKSERPVPDAFRLEMARLSKTAL